MPGTDRPCPRGGGSAEDWDKGQRMAPPWDGLGESPFWRASALRVRRASSGF